jgi:hypothetical protein
MRCIQQIRLVSPFGAVHVIEGVKLIVNRFDTALNGLMITDEGVDNSEFGPPLIALVPKDWVLEVIIPSKFRNQTCSNVTK